MDWDKSICPFGAFPIPGPDGAERVFSGISVPICSPDAVDWEKGIESFPFGRTSWTATYLSLWLMGTLRVFAGAARPTHLAAALCPLCLAAGSA